MAVLDELVVELRADVDGLKRQLNSATIASKRTGDQMQGSFDRARASMLGLTAAAASLYAGVQSLRGITGVITSFEKLEASLVTVTGSQKAANAEFERLREFATTTPFELEEVIASFIKMKALGLDPSQEALGAFGNTASAMGKSLNQMIEAVADAATGEFERLKEFGIRAKTQGDEVTFIFQGVSTTVRKNADEITDYLKSIGQVQFAGAMDAQAETLNVAISNLGASFRELLNTIGEAGLTDALAGISRYLTEINQEIQKTINFGFRPGTVAARLFGSSAEGQRGQLLEQERQAVADLQEQLKRLNETGSTGQDFAPDLQKDFMGEDITDKDRLEEQRARFDELMELRGEYADILLEHEGATLEMVRQLQQEHEDARLQVIEDGIRRELQLRNMSARDKVLTASKELQDIIGVTSSYNKTLFNLKKVAMLSEATLSARKTVVDAYEKGNSIGGPLLGASFAVTAGIAQAANIAQIASSSYGGGGGGVGSVGGGAAPMPVTNVDEFNRPTQQAAPRPINITISNVGDDTLLNGRQVRDLIGQLSEALNDGARLDLQGGSIAL